MNRLVDKFHSEKVKSLTVNDTEGCHDAYQISNTLHGNIGHNDTQQNDIQLGKMTFSLRTFSIQHKVALSIT